MKTSPYSELLISKENSQITYQDLLRTEEWKNKREEIINRDGKRCSKCDLSGTGSFAHYDEKTKIYSYITEDGKEYIRYVKNKDGIIVKESVPRITITNKPYHLQVHHKYYIFNQLPWEYEETALITLCNWCHSETHEIEKIIMYYDGSKGLFEELIPCERCYGAGWFSHYSHIQNGVCFKCNGKRFKRELIEK